MRYIQRSMLVFLCLCIAFSSAQPVTVAAFSLSFKTPRKEVKALEVGKDVADATIAADVRTPEAIQGNLSEPVEKKVTVQNTEIDHEDVSKRTVNTKTFINKDGSKTLSYSPFAQHYKGENSQWKDLNKHPITPNVSAFEEPRIESPFRSPQPHEEPESYVADGGDLRSTLRPFNEGIEVSFKDKKFTIKPQGAKNIRPTVRNVNGQDIITYKNVWPSVDVEYEIVAGSLKETIILKNKQAGNAYVFAIEGAEVEQHPTEKGAVAIKGVNPDEFFISPLSINVNGRGIISETVSRNVVSPKSLAVVLDSDWLESQPKEAFPIAIDPSFVNNVGGTYGNFIAYKSDGYSCNSSICDPQAGTLWDNGWKHWRTMFRIPFDQLQGKRLLDADLLLVKKQRTYWTGGDEHRYFRAGWAPCFGFNCIQGGDAISDYQLVSTGEWIDVTRPLDFMVRHGQWGGWFILDGENVPYTTYKQFEPTRLEMRVIYDTPTPVATPISPLNQQFTVSTQPSLRVNPVNDADGDAVRYYFRVATNPDAETGVVINSGWIQSSQWTIPSGVLQDGNTYYWHVYTLGATQTNPNWVHSFKVDMRTGKDSTQAYDTIGPVSVDLATGNTVTSNSTHDIAALGGPIGLSMNYNSPAMSRQGLAGEYWNTGGVDPGTAPARKPDMVRIDQQVNFDWSTGNPGGSIGNDWYFARWSGYLTVPKSGWYAFGGSNDDRMAVSVDGKEVYRQNCYRFNAPRCFGQQVYLEAGKVVPIKVEYLEGTSVAYAQLYVRNADSVEQIVPSEWLHSGAANTNNNHGLMGYYYLNDGSGQFPSDIRDKNRLMMVRNDARIGFNWGGGSPVPGMQGDNFMVRWKGYITVPVDGNYTLGATADDNIRIKLGTGLFGGDETVLDSWYYRSDVRWGNTKYLKKGVQIPITIEFLEAGGAAAINLLVKSDQLAMQDLPSAWLTSKANALPNGWELGLDVSGSVRFERLSMQSNAAVLYDSTGSSHRFVYASGGKYTPPEDEAASLVKNNDGTHTLIDIDGRIYVFNVEGQLTSVTTPEDERNPTALKYEYASNPSRLVKVIDGVTSQRFGTLHYKGVNENGKCEEPGEFDAVPAGMLCAFETSDGQATQFLYRQGRLSRIVKPGDDINDYGYDELGRIISIRDTLASDVIAAGVRQNSPSTTSELSYDAVGRLSKVIAPSAQEGSSRAAHTYKYLVGATEMDSAELQEPYGFSKRVEYDGTFRTTAEIDIANIKKRTEWHPIKDLVLSTTDETGLKSTNIYNNNDRIVRQYGPAKESWFDAVTREPIAGREIDIPRTDIGYDEGIKGLAVTYFNLDDKTKTLSGAPIKIATNLSSSPTRLSHEFGASGPTVEKTDFWGARLTGTFVSPATGSHRLAAASDNGIRIWFNGKLVLDKWSDKAWSYQGEAFVDVKAGETYDIQIDYYHRTGDAGIHFTVTEPGGTSTHDTLKYLNPNYGLLTSQKVFDADQGDLLTTRQYDDPTYGLMSAEIVDPNGLNHKTAVTHEEPSEGFLRQTGSILPGGTRTTYQHYSAQETRDNPCTDAVEAYIQAGFTKGKTDVDPDGAGPAVGRTSEAVYDAAGRAVASRFNNDSWTCTEYDDRGRVTKVATPARDGRIGRTVTTQYNHENNPLRTLTFDSVAGSTVTEVDLLGRSVKTVDRYGNESVTEYGHAGRVSRKTSLLGVEEFSYDSYGRITEQKIDGKVYASISYDQYGRITGVDYPQAKNESGQTLKFLAPAFDEYGRGAKSEFQFSNGSLFTEAVNRTANNRIKSVATTLDGKTAHQTFNYDILGRLTKATVDNWQFDYGFGAHGASCAAPEHNPLAGMNGNRTSYAITNTADGTATQTEYCYNLADQLVSSTDANIGTPQYDSRGNTISFSGAGDEIRLEYDALDQNTAIEQSSVRTEFLKDSNGTVLEKKTYRDGELDRFQRFSGGVSYECQVTNTSMCGIAEKIMTLEGGVTLTINPQEQDAVHKEIYGIQDFRKNTVVKADAKGAVLDGISLSDPYGGQIFSATFNDPADYAIGEFGEFTLSFQQQGARTLASSIGRFLQVDPVQGGTSNAYAYVNDPVNDRDPTGKWSLMGFVKNVSKAVTNTAKRAASYVASAVRQVTQAVVGVVQSAYNGVRKTIAEVTRVVHQVATTVRHYVTVAAAHVVSAATQAVRTAAAYTKAVVTSIQQAVYPVTSTITRAAVSIGEFGVAVGTTVASGAQKAASAVKDFVTNPEVLKEAAGFVPIVGGIMEVDNFKTECKTGISWSCSGATAFMVLGFIPGGGGLKAAGKGAKYGLDGAHALKNQAAKRGFEEGTLQKIFEIQRNKGNFGLESASREKADELGDAWVGSDKVKFYDSNGIELGYKSEDGLKQYRYPKYKPDLGKYQANIEEYIVDPSAPGGKIQIRNGHLDIID